MATLAGLEPATEVRQTSVIPIHHRANVLMRGRKHDKVQFLLADTTPAVLSATLIMLVL